MLISVYKRSSAGNSDPRAVNYEGRNMQRSHLPSAIPICTTVELECISILQLLTVILCAEKSNY